MNRPWYICTDDSRLQGRILAGCAYKALTSGEISFKGDPALVPAIHVQCTDGVERWYPVDRFRPATEAELASLRNPETWKVLSLDMIRDAVQPPRAKRRA